MTKPKTRVDALTLDADWPPHQPVTLTELVAEARAFVRNTALAWKVPPRIGEVAGDEVSAVLAFLHANGAPGAAGKLVALNDGARFRLRLIYAAPTNPAHRTPQPLTSHPVAASAPLDLENEEQAAFADNTVRYQATLTFLSARFKGLMTAITGQ